MAVATAQFLAAEVQGGLPENAIKTAPRNDIGELQEPVKKTFLGCDCPSQCGSLPLWRRCPRPVARGNCSSVMTLDLFSVVFWMEESCHGNSSDLVQEGRPRGFGQRLRNVSSFSSISVGVRSGNAENPFHCVRIPSSCLRISGERSSFN